MTSNRTKIKWSALHRLAISMTVLAAVVFPALSSAQVPGRFYWKSLSGGNGVPVIFQSISGNANPFDSANTVTPGAEIDASMAIVGYAHNFTLLDRSATAAILMPMGRLSGELLFAGETVKESSQGFGDPMLEFDINVIGPKSQKSLSDALRYEPGFSLDLLADLALPIGTYDNNQSLNLGQNRWYGRIGAPIALRSGSAASPGTSARGYRGAAQLWNSCRPCGCSAITTISAERPCRPTRCSSWTRI